MSAGARAAPTVTAPRIRPMVVVVLLILRFSDASSSYLENERVEGGDQKIPASPTYIK